MAGQLQEARSGSAQEDKLIASAAHLLQLPEGLSRQQLLELGPRLQVRPGMHWCIVLSLPHLMRRRADMLVCIRAG